VRLVEQVPADDAGLGGQRRGDPAPRRHERGLDLVAVAEEVRERLGDRGGELAGVGRAAGAHPVEARRPRRRAVPADRGGQAGRTGLALRRGDVLAPRILVQVYDRRHPLGGSVADRAAHPGQVGLGERAALGLPGRPVGHQAHDVEAETPHAGEVGAGERDHRRLGWFGGVVVAELVDVHAAQQDLAARPVDERRVLPALDGDLRERRGGGRREQQRGDDGQKGGAHPGERSPARCRAHGPAGERLSGAGGGAAACAAPSAGSSARTSPSPRRSSGAR
jgi:hypothetical protein